MEVSGKVKALCYVGINLGVLVRCDLPTTPCIDER